MQCVDRGSRINAWRLIQLFERQWGAYSIWPFSFVSHAEKKSDDIATLSERSSRTSLNTASWSLLTPSRGGGAILSGHV